MTTSYILPWLSVLILLVAYVLVATEEISHMRKSKPVLLSAGIIWILVALSQSLQGNPLEDVAIAYEEMFLEFAELFCFLLVAMTFINALTERNFFSFIRQTLVEAKLSKRQLFWGTGWLTFFVSPIADNLTTALLMGAVLSAVDPADKKFIGIGFVNIVVAANAGGAFSPFGDVTTLMVWQNGVLAFTQFFALLLPSIVNFLIPALIMQFYISTERPDVHAERVILKEGAFSILAIFLTTIAFTVAVHQIFHLPAVFGMLAGLGLLNTYGYFLKRHASRHATPDATASTPLVAEFDIFNKIARAEWDTLLFFYGVIASVSGIAYFGLLSDASTLLYGQLGPSLANSVMGVVSAVVDNIPIMYAVLTMQPVMSDAQWLLITLTAGTGGSLLSIGSAAGVALMGQSNGTYTFISHLKWSWAIFLGYVSSILLHIALSN